MINVGFLITEPYVIKHVYNVKGVNKYFYDGALVELWNKIKKDLNLETNNVYYEISDHDKIFTDLQKNKIDIIVGPIKLDINLYNNLRYSEPIMLNPIEIAYYSKSSTLSKYISTFYRKLLYPILMIIFIGCILGYILYKIEPNRGKKRAIFSTIASMLGEMGSIAENSNLGIIGMIFCFSLMLFSYYGVIFLQALTVDDVMNNDFDEITLNNVANKKILIEHDNEIRYLLKNYYNVDVVEYNSTNKKLNIYEYYVKNYKKFDGFVDDFQRLQFLKKNDKNLVISKSIFAYNTIRIASNKKNQDLLYKINGQIIELIENKYFLNVCKKYFPNEQQAMYCHI